ncbi:MAG: LicD family protein [Muribaculum sp.]|nr:LicD family protein [Muribaculum sp.]
MIDSQIQSELRRRFNPDGSLLRAHQMRMLDILIYVDKVCRRNGIMYWLSSGTMLGAVRHGGYIPWDDDVDIEMTDSDYRRLVALIAADSTSPYVLQHTASDNGFLFPFAKLRDTDSYIEEADGLDAGQKYNGVYIDIFRLRPSNSHALHRLTSRMLGTELKFRSRHPHSRIPAAMLRGLLHGIIFPLIRLLDSLGRPARLRHMIPSYFAAPRFTADLYPLSEVEFEGHSFLAPRDPDAYLKRIYGDYMSIPDPDKIQIHTSKVVLHRNNQSTQ